MFSVPIPSLLRTFVTGLIHCLRAGNSLTPMVILYFSLSVLLAILTALSSAWWQATTCHLDKHGFNRLTVESTGSTGLTNQVLRSLQEKFPCSQGFRVVPQYTTVIYLLAADGNYKPFLASSTVVDDPLLMESPELHGEPDLGSEAHSPFDRRIPDVLAEAARGQGLVLSPDIIRRLGFANQNHTPPEIRIRVHRAGHPEENWDFNLPVVGMIGNLGKLGVRIPLDGMISIRRFQYYGADGVEESLAVTTASLTHAKKQFGEVEINAIHLQIPAEVSIEDILAQVKNFGPTFQLSSPWFEHGMQRSLLSTALRLAAPLLGLLIGTNAIVLLVLVYQKTANDKLQLAMMKMSGASSACILAWYALPLTTLAAVITACGIVLAKLFVELQFLPILELSNQQPIVVHVPYPALWIVLLLVTAFVHLSLTLRQTCSVSLETALG